VPAFRRDQASLISLVNLSIKLGDLFTWLTNLSLFFHPLPFKTSLAFIRLLKLLLFGISSDEVDVAIQLTQTGQTLQVCTHNGDLVERHFFTDQDGSALRWRAADDDKQYKCISTIFVTVDVTAKYYSTLFFSNSSQSHLRQ
jgi:hypothetical protein